MNRRDLLKLITAATGTAMVGVTGTLTGCANEFSKPIPLKFSEQDLFLLDEVAETIIPRTDTPGAKDAEVGRFMTVFVRDCYTPEQQKAFHQGLAQLNARAEQTYGAGFRTLSQEQKLALVHVIDSEAKQVAAVGGELHYFTLLKQLTLFGFFTSQVGGTQVLRYMAIPGRYDGCMPYEEGDRAWATS